MTTETINGLHSCKPENEPQPGETKTFVIEHRPAKNGKKAWIKIKSAGPDYGGTLFRIISAEPTGFTDTHGNISFNLEIEPVDDLTERDYPSGSGPEGVARTPLFRTQKLSGGGGGENTQKPVQAASSPSQTSNGVEETRRHIMQSANLYVLCVNAVNNYVAAHLPEVVQTSEQFQAAVGTLFIEASHKRTNDGVNWWSYVDKMPVTPIK